MVSVGFDEYFLININKQKKSCVPILWISCSLSGSIYFDPCGDERDAANATLVIKPINAIRASWSHPDDIKRHVFLGPIL